MSRIPTFTPYLLGCSLLLGQQAEPSKAKPNPWVLGVHAGLGMSVGSDLKATTEGKPGLQVGARATYTWAESQAVRLKLDHLSFPEGRQTQGISGLGQTLHTSVKGLGMEALYVLRFDRLEVGAGIAWTRWTVDSRNTLDDTLGHGLTHTGNSSWSKAGFAASVGMPVYRNWSVEARFLSSQYGYEDAPVRMASLNAIWTF